VGGVSLKPPGISATSSADAFLFRL
jgi:hypothetical protein